MSKDLVARKQGLALLADLESAGALTSTGLRLADPDLPYSTYEAIGALLGKTHRALQWAIGDYILHGEALFGELAYQAIESLDISDDAKREYVRVASRVPRSIRRPELSWSIHRAVAALPPPEQREWLKRTRDEQLSHHDLRLALRNGSASDHDPGICPRCKRPL